MGYSVQNQRQLRVGEQVRHILSEVVRDCFFDDPELQDVNSLTISEVRISPDLKNATAYVVPLGGQTVVDNEVFMTALNRASAYFRREVSNKLRMRNTPRIKFESDVSFTQAAHVNDLLSDKKVRRDLEKNELAGT